MVQRVSEPEVGLQSFDVEVARARAALVEERRRLRDAELVGRSGSWDWDIASGRITWSEGLFALHGLDPMSFDDGYSQAASRVHEDDRKIVDEVMMACRHDESVHQFRYRVHRVSDGETRWFDSRARGVFDHGQLVRLTGAVADVTDQIIAEREVIEANRFLNAVLMASPDYTFITDLRTGAMIYGSRDRDLVGRSSEETASLGTETISRIVHPEDQGTLRAMNKDAADLMDGETLQGRFRFQHANGNWHWMSRLIVPFRRDQSGAVIEVLGVIRDITDVVIAEEQMFHGALHDALTGLPNRSLLMDRLDAALLRSSHDGREVAVLYCDLDGFKDVNDSAGHAAGDAVLVETARRLLSAVREGDTVARFGGDEFVVVVEPWNRGTGPKAGVSFSVEVAERVLRAISRPFVVNGVEHALSVSIGVAHPLITASDGVAAERAATVIESADAAMYEAKRKGKNRIEVFDDPLHTSS
jgi:diguanylate cyclase (GGDEF)-like protein/PAS domain S-box-containing protein